jgi:hypothetical protein
LRSDGWCRPDPLLCGSDNILASHEDLAGG